MVLILIEKLTLPIVKEPYSEPESIDCDIKTFENLEDLEKHRSDLSYNMSEQETINYNNYLILKIQLKNKIDKNV